jgi:hypothetical protein
LNQHQLGADGAHAPRLELTFAARRRVLMREGSNG